MISAAKFKISKKKPSSFYCTNSEFARSFLQVLRNAAGSQLLNHLLMYREKEGALYIPGK